MMIDRVLYWLRNAVLAVYAAASGTVQNYRTRKGWGSTAIDHRGRRVPVVPVMPHA